ncbi:MAG: DUF4296 domain-containing protein [Bacteroidetes bacterium]|nr:DUF4296 domain-containing protein [Bacteroidota bacterium]
MRDRQALQPSFSPALLGAILLLSTGCIDPSSPANSIPDSTLAHVISDFYLADAEFQLDVLSDSLGPDATDALSAGKPLRDSILASHGLDEQAFMKSMEEYIDDPNLYVSLYDQILDRLIMERQANPLPGTRFESSTR